MKSEILNLLPVWLILLVVGAAVMVVGAASKLVVGGNSLELSAPLNVAVMAAGGVLLLVGVVDFLRSRKTAEDGVQVQKIEVRSIKVSDNGGSIRALVSGRVEPPTQGIRVWLLREHQARCPGRFHVGDQPALTDKHGNWQQITYLWPNGTFRIHAVIVGRTTEALFSYYRRAFNHARSIYQKEVNPSADSFPDWPLLEELPTGCVYDFEVVDV